MAELIFTLRVDNGTPWCEVLEAYTGKKFARIVMEGDARLLMQRHAPEMADEFDDPDNTWEDMGWFEDLEDARQWCAREYETSTSVTWKCKEYDNE